MVRNIPIVFVGGLLVALSAGVVWAQGDFKFAFRAAPELPAPDLIDPVLGEIDCIENDGPRWPAGSDALAGAPGTVVQGAYFCTLEQVDPCVGVVPILNPDPPLAEILGPCTSGTTGAQGWQMIFTASGCDAVILGATAGQTDIAPGSIEDCEKGPGGNGGFDATEVYNSHGGLPEGVVHAIVLHLKKGTTLDPTSINFRPATGPEENPATVCRFLVEWEIPPSGTCDMMFKYHDFIMGGQPIDNKVTQEGQSVNPLIVDKVVRSFAGVPFIRADTNVDGATDISDAIRTFMFLFQGASDPPCLSAADSNDDGGIDISDGIHTLNDLFMPGTAIPEPGPFRCGVDPTADDLTCLAFDLCP